MILRRVIAHLRRALVALQQKRSALAFLVGVQSPKAIDLPAEFPKLIAAEAAFSPERGEVVVAFRCNLAKMRQDQRFLNALSGDADRYDAFIRDGLAPWSTQFDEVHDLVDTALGIADHVIRH
jgi:hypothetical protein